MRLNNTPPDGAGKGQGTTKTELLLKHIEGLGNDKVTGNPIGIRVAALSEATGVGVTSIPTLLSPYVANGRLQCCKITRPGLAPMNEYRKGVGVATDFKPLNTKRTHIAHAAGIKPLPVTTPAPTLSTPRPKIEDIVTPTLTTKTQPEVVAPTFAQTPAAGDEPTTPAVAPAVAAKATPKPAAGAVLKKEPATRKASAGDDELLLSIDQDGALQVGYGDDPARWVFMPRHVLALGDFLDATQGLWRP